MKMGRFDESIASTRSAGDRSELRSVLRRNRTTTSSWGANEESRKTIAKLQGVARNDARASSGSDLDGCLLPPRG